MSQLFFQVLLKMNTSMRVRTDDRLKKRGALEWKFGLLRLEFYRETRKQMRKLKHPVLPLPQTVYTVVIRISVPFYSALPESDAFKTTAKIKWTCQCLGSLSIGQVKYVVMITKLKLPFIENRRVWVDLKGFLHISKHKSHKHSLNRFFLNRMIQWFF